MYSSKSSKFGRKYPFIQKRKSDSEKVELQRVICQDRSKSKSQINENYLNDIAILLIIFQVSDNRRRDIDGMVATVFDSLVHGRVLKDDSLRDIPSVIATFVRCKKGEEGVDLILIEP
ncbi:MAG: RusA family crossover junction endodeoxyribonuclease [Leptospira sp.]|nr:RusA family crossover junction endodeoxyribonuclease [Leptospira sp.]